MTKAHFAINIYHILCSMLSDSDLMDTCLQRNDINKTAYYGLYLSDSVVFREEHTDFFLKMLCFVTSNYSCVIEKNKKRRLT